MAMLQACYAGSQYASFARVGRMHRELLDGLCEFVPVADHARADVIGLHHEPHVYESAYRAFPGLAEKYVIACCVWEASTLPDEYKRTLDRVQEVWTPSHYCCTVFEQYHPCVVYVPHVVERDTECSAEDLAVVRSLIDYDAANVYSLFITKLWDKRQNTRGSSKPFSACGGACRGRGW